MKPNKTIKMITPIILISLLTGQLYCMDCTDVQELPEDTICEEAEVDITAIPETVIETAAEATTGEDDGAEDKAETGQPKYADIPELANTISTGGETYSIRYELNGGVNNANNPATYSDKKNVSLKKATRDGYVFKGWYKDADFSGKKVTKIPKTTVGTVTLYAKWAPAKYTIKYTLTQKGVKLKKAKHTNPSKYHTGDKYTFSIPSFKSAKIGGKNADFEGWYLDKNYTKKSSGITADMTGNIKVYAKWVESSETQGEEGAEDWRVILEKYKKTKYRKEAEKVVELVNKERAKVGAYPLEMNDDLMTAATVRANEETVTYKSGRVDADFSYAHSRIYFKKNRWDMAFSVMDDLDITNVEMIGENAAWSSKSTPNPEFPVKAWMESTQGHREQMLRTDCTLIGIGIACTKNGSFYYLVIGNKVDPTDIFHEVDPDLPEENEPDIDSTYTLSFDANGGKGSVPSSITIKFGDTSTALPDANLTRYDDEDGDWYDFAYWSNDPAGKGSRFKAGTKVKMVATQLGLKTDDKVVLYAVYK